MKRTSLVKNSFFNMVYRGFSALFPLLTTTYIARTLLPERAGLVSYANTIALYFTTVASLGIPNYGVKEISRHGDDIPARSKSFLEFFTINGISTSICTIAYFLLINLSPYFAGKRAVLNTMGLLLILNFCNVDWFYQGIEEYKLISVRSILVKLISFAAMLIFVHKPSDYLIYALILCFATAGNYLYNIAVLPRYIKIRKVTFQLKKHLTAVFILLASTLATELYTTLDSVMLEYYVGTASVAYYSNAVKIVRMVYTLVIAMIAPLYPRISFYLQNDEEEKSNRLLNYAIRIVILLGVPAVIGIFLLADQIVLILFGLEYLRSIDVLRIASVLILMFSVAYTLGHIVLMAAGEEKNILKATLVGAAVNAVMNFTLIPVFQERGAILASVFSEITVTTILIFYGRKNYTLKHDARYYLTVAAASGCMTVVIVAARRLLIGRMPHILSFMLIFFLAAGVYLGILILLKNDVVIDLKAKFLSKRKRRSQKE